MIEIIVYIGFGVSIGLLMQDVIPYLSENIERIIDTALIITCSLMGVNHDK